MKENGFPEGSAGFTKVLHIGFTIAGSIALFIWLGMKLDEKCGTGTVFTIAGFLWGITGSNLYVYFKFFKNKL